MRLQGEVSLPSAVPLQSSVWKKQWASFRYRWLWMLSGGAIEPATNGCVKTDR